MSCHGGAMNASIFSMEKVKESVARITNAQVYVVTTGAGAAITDLLWQRAGASNFLIGTSFTYHPVEFDDFVGRAWDNTGFGRCSPTGAMALAQRAYLRSQKACMKSGKAGARVIGVGLSAAATTDRTLRGGTRCHAAVRTDRGIFLTQISWEQGCFTREGDGSLCDLIALNLVLFAADAPQLTIPDHLRLTSNHLWYGSSGAILKPSDVGVAHLPHPLAEPQLVTLDGQVQPTSHIDFSQAVIFPGSFNPFQYGHDAMARMGEQVTERSVICEITAQNADKAEQTPEQLSARASQFLGRWPVILRTGAGLFVDKAREYRGAHFIVGGDTALRIFDPRFYGSDVNRTLELFHEYGTRFYVFAREFGDRLITCEDLPVSYDFRHLFVPLPGRWDISSTAIREARVA